MGRRLLILGALAVVFLAAVTVAAWPVTGPSSHVPATLQQPLDAKVAGIETDLEKASGCQLAGATQCTYRCSAHTFDLDPRDAATIDSVTAAYALVTCQIIASNDIDSESQDVVALKFASPATQSGLPDDATWADVVKVFPPHAAGAAWWYYTGGTFTLRDRLHRFTSL
jgi:hypothetical protein